MGIDYIIVSKPDYIIFDCPHCKEEDIQVNFYNVDFKTDYWGDGTFVNCPNCGKEIELDNYDYE